MATKGGGPGLSSVIVWAIVLLMIAAALGGCAAGRVASKCVIDPRCDL